MTAGPSIIRRRILPAAAATAMVALLAGGAWYGYEAISTQPVKRVVFAGDTAKLARADLELFASSIRESSAGASLESVREAARRIPWVREANVRRVFPDAVEVTFEAHAPLARWSEGGLVSVRGELFNADYDGTLPRFKGPESGASSMAREYPAILRALAPLATGVAELRLSPRGAWQVVLESGITLELGRGDIQARLARFVAAWPSLASQGVDARHADLRYANGFAVRQKSK